MTSFDINSLPYVPSKTAVTFKESALIQFGKRIFDELGPEKLQCMRSIIGGLSSSSNKKTKTKKRGRKRNYNMITTLEGEEEDNEDDQEENEYEDQKSKRLKTVDYPTLRGINRFLKRMNNEEYLAVFWKKVSDEYVPVHILQSIRHLTLMWQQHWVDPVGRQGTTEYWPFPATTCQKVFFAWLFSADVLERMKIVEKIPLPLSTNKMDNNRVFLFEKPFRFQKPRPPALKKFFKIETTREAKEQYYRNFIDFHVKIQSSSLQQTKPSKFMISTKRFVNLFHIKYINQKEKSKENEGKEELKEEVKEEDLILSLTDDLSTKTKLKIKDKKRIRHENSIVFLLTKSKKTSKGLPLYLFQDFNPTEHLIKRCSWRVKSQKEIEYMNKQVLQHKMQEKEKEKNVIYDGSRKKKFHDEDDDET